MDRLQSMRVFARVADEGGFAAAARRLDLDPAVVTRLVADLEGHLGSALLQRTTRRVSLTPAGEEYLGRVRAILAEIDDAEAAVQGQSTTVAGRTRVLALSGVATHIVAPAAAAFIERYPGIQLELRSFATGDPHFEDHDLTFVTGMTPLPADVVARELAAGDLTLFAAPDYLARHGVPQHPSDLRHHRILKQRLARESLDHMRLMNPLDGEPDEVVAVSPVLVTDAADPLLRATLEGAGISSHPQAMVASYVHSGQLRPVLPPWITGRATLLAVYPGRKFLNAGARVFLEHVVRLLRNNLPQLQASMAAAAAGAPGRVGSLRSPQ